MDHATTTVFASVIPDDSLAKVVGTLHRGALREIDAERRLKKPLHQLESTKERFHSSLVELSDLRAGFTLSEPRPSRRRCTSGEEFTPLNLFDTAAAAPTNFEKRKLLFDDADKEAFSLKIDMRRRRKQSPTRTNNDLSRKEHEKLMKSIQQRYPRNSPSHHRRASSRRSRWVIPIDHPFKTIWDIVTVIFSIAHAHAMHVSIRERKFGSNYFTLFCNVWFLLDILLNFFSERRTADGEILRDYRSICARYLTSWFAVDILALMPWETLYVKPIIELQNKRGFFRKYFLRSRAVVRVTRHLRGRHLRWFGTVARHTKQHGIGAHRLLRLIIRYAPKYFMFLRNMKAVVAVRILRQIQWFRRFYNNVVKADVEKSDSMTGSLTRDDFDESDDLSSKESFRGQPGKNNRVQVVYESWEFMDGDDDDDGVPL